MLIIFLMVQSYCIWFVSLQVCILSFSSIGWENSLYFLSKPCRLSVNALSSNLRLFFFLGSWQTVIPAATERLRLIKHISICISAKLFFSVQHFTANFIFNIRIFVKSLVWSHHSQRYMETLCAILFNLASSYCSLTVIIIATTIIWTPQRWFKWKLAKILKCLQISL